MSRILIAYASSHGQTRAIADALAARLESRGHVCELADTGFPVPALDGFEAVILGSRIQYGKHAPAIERFVLANRARLVHVPTAFYSVSMSAAQKDAGPDPNGYLEAFFKRTSWRPDTSAVFAGALRYRRYPWLLRQVMRILAKQGGHSTDTSRDHVYTDWAAVARFADHVAAALQAPAPLRSPAYAETGA